MSKTPDLVSEELYRLLEVAGDRELVAVMELIDKMQAKRAFRSHIDKIRPKLAQIRPPRNISFARLVTLPFEDLLVPDSQWVTSSMTIARGNLGAILDCARDVFDSEEIAAVEGRMRAAKMSNTKVLCEFGGLFWSRAADALRAQARPANGWQRSLAEQAQNAACMLEVAELMCPLLERLPTRPMGDLSSDQIHALSAKLRILEERSIEAFGQALRWLVARSFKPEILLVRLLRGQIGASLVGREELANSLVLEILRRQRMALVHFQYEKRDLSAAIADVEIAAGSFLSIADRAREFGLVPAQIDATGQVLHQVIMRVLSSAVNERYLQTIDTLDNAATSDEQVEAIEAEARAVRRIIALAEACGLKTQAQGLIGVAGENAAAELRGRYGASADPMTVVDQIRTFEFMFGGEQARKLWQEFTRRRRSSVREVATASNDTTPSKAMIAALKLG